MKEKDYIVIITTKKTEINVGVKAVNKNEAKEKIIDILNRCNLFGYKSINDFKLIFKRTRREI